MKIFNIYQSLVKQNFLEKVLIIGLALRVIVYLFLSPFNNDPHYEIIQHIFYMKEIPLAHQYDQAYHPPLYYIIASLFLNFGNEKAVQFFSFILSSLTLFIIYLTINKLDFIQPISIKIICLLVAAFLPPFVVFGLYISNDTLSYLIGASLFLQIYNYINKPTIINGMFLAVLLGVGLLTKATLIAFIPALIFVLIITNIRKKVPHNKTVLLLCIFLAVSLSIGSYKYIQNTVSLGTPIIHNLDFNPIWAEQQKPTLQGISSFVDFNILKLVETPTVSSSTLHSLPLLFYGTFWYEYIPESSFRGNLTNLSKVGSLIYVIALIPAMLIFLGLMRIVSSLPSLQDCTSLEDSVYKKNIFEWSALLILLVNLTMVVVVGLKYDVWSCFQSRLLFISLVPILVTLSAGFAYIHNKSLVFYRITQWSLIVLFLLFVSYFVFEILLIIHGLYV